MSIQNYNINFYPFLPPNCDKPPTLYSILNSIVNGEKEEEDYTKIRNLAKEGRSTIFNFDYELSEKITKEKFETMILNHFLTRRIGFETVTNFIIQLDVKINEIMPMYNKMFDAITNWNLFNDGETTITDGTNNNTNNKNNTRNNNRISNRITNNSLENNATNHTDNLSDRKNSELPQNQLQDLRDESYVTNYNYDNNIADSQDNSTSRGNSTENDNTNENINENINETSNNAYHETVTRSPADKIAIYKEVQENFKNIFTMIFKDLECLFYQLV